MSGGDTADGSSFFNDTETVTNKSFVKKVKSRVSGLFPSSLTKWFGTPQDGPKIRHREDLEEDEETCLLQPPTKRVKLPTVPEPQTASTSRSDLEMTFLTQPLHNEHRPAASAFSNKIMSFSEPLPIAKSTRKLVLPSLYNLKNNYNGDLQNGDKDSDSGESTSGYSSMPRIGSKEQVSDDKHGTPNKQLADNISLFNSPAPAERSLFGDNTRMASPNLNTSLSSRRPAFNTSAFGSSNFMDRTLSTKRIVNSPFYSGRTSYGGASAYSRNLLKRPASELKNFVQPKPIATVKNVTLSKTAKRILDTLEQYTSPSEDVKRIPNPKRPQKYEGLISKYTGANPYSVRESKVASNRELQVPTMTDVLKMKLKERLQDSTQSVRELATTSKSPLNVEEYKLLQQEVTDSSAVRSSNKMKTKISSVRPRAEPVEILQDVRLPDVQLPISKLPNFDFNIPLPIKEAKPVNVPKEIPTPKPTSMFKASSNTTAVATAKIANKQLSQDLSLYKFSKPLVISNNLKSIKAINNFKFSKPVCKKSTSQKNEEPAVVAVNFKSSSNNSTPLLRKKVNGENAAISAEKELKTTGSVSDVLGRSKSLMDKFKPATGTWECSVCMIMNVQDKTKCVACETPKQSTVTAPSTNQSGFGSQFKMSSDKWECDSCLVRNEESKTKCVACETPRKSTVAVAANGPKIAIPSSFGDKFKPVTSSWECGTCLIRNEQDKVKCVACETPKPGSTVIKADVSFGTSFTKKNDEWECSSCMVRNTSDKVKCVCCEAVKPGCTQIVSKSLVNDEQQIVPKFNFGIDKAKVDGQGFSFSASTNNAVAPSSVFGDSAKTSTAAPTTITFGDNKTPNGTKLKETPQFSFGVPSATAKASSESSDVDTAKSINGKLGNTTSIPTTVTPAFSFGAKPAEKPAIQIGTVIPTPSVVVESEQSKVESSRSCTDIRSEGPVIKFGKVESTSSAAATTSSLFNSTVKTSTTTATTSSNMFSFSATNTNSNKVSFGESAAKPLSFGQNNTAKPIAFGEKAKPASFGESSAKPITFGQNSAKPITFGDSTNAKPTNFGETPTKAPPTFGQSLPTKPITFGESTTKPSTFGASSVSTTKPSMFGENAAKVACLSEDKTKAASFGSVPQTQSLSFGTGTPFAAAAPFSSSASTFGSNNTTSKSTFFGERASNNKAPAMFGGPQKSTASTEFKIPTFNAPAFGSSATQSASTFGAPTAAPSSSTPTFGSSAQSGSTFGAPSQNGGFFSAPAASNNAITKPSFGFGNAAAAAGPSTTGTFNFNPNAGASSIPAGGFNFNNPVPNFSAEVKPSFNFTAGSAPSSFTAQPSEGSSQAGKPQRVFRKALRRTQR